jgi:hypothetical protein
MALLMTACATEFFYNRLDTLASWYFEDLTSLNDDQRHELRGWLERTLAWHRQSELGRYAKFVEEISQAAATPGDRATYEQLRRRFEGYVEDLADKTAPDAARLLLGLSSAQANELLDNLASKARARTAKSAKAVASNKWQREQHEDLSRQLKRWTGSISEPQQQIIAAGVRELEPTYLDWAASQQAWREALRSALAEDHSDVGTQQRISALLRKPSAHWTEPYAQKIAHNRDAPGCVMKCRNWPLSLRKSRRARNEQEAAAQLESWRERSGGAAHLPECLRQPQTDASGAGRIASRSSAGGAHTIAGCRRGRCGNCQHRPTGWRQ